MAEYNGWSNYETWLVNLHLNEGNHLEEITRLARKSKTLNELAESLKEFVSDLLIPENSRDYFLLDVINSTLSAVNWEEIAQPYQIEFLDEEEEEDELQDA